MVQTVLISGGTSGMNAAGYESAYYVGNEGGVPDDVYNFFWEEMKSGDRRPRSRSGEAFTFPVT